jgi:hypothetical protein
MPNETVIGGTPPPPSIRVTPQQLAVLLILEAQMAQLQVGANQLGGTLNLTEAADILVSARDYIQKNLAKLQKKWAGEVVIAQPNEVPRLVRES